MTTRYTVFNWKEYVSLRRYWNMQWKYETLKAKCDELEKENRTLKKEFEQYKQNYNIERDRQSIFLMTWRRY